MLLLTTMPAAHADTALSDRPFLSSSLFMLANVVLEDSPDFYQLNLGLPVGERDVLLVEAITWSYWAPLGVPLGPDYDDPSTFYPGFVRGRGVGVAWQHTWWRGLFSTVHATPMLQTYHETGGERIQAGFQLFTVARAGWHADLFGGRVFVEPSVAVTSWPINTNLPAGFQAEEDRWRSFFVGEPGLNVGVRL